MKHSIILLTLISGLSLAACEKTTVEKAPETIVVPVPTPVPGPSGEKGATGQSGDDGMKGDTGNTGSEGAKGDTGITGSEGDKGDTGKTGGDTVIIVPSAEVAQPTN